MRNLERMLKRIIGEDIELVTKFDPALKAVIADPGQLEQVVLNMTVNARDAMPNGGKLIIETGNVHLDEEYVRSHLTPVAGDYVMLAVTDTGVGIDAETKSHLFEPFFTTKEIGKGTGLGLSIVYGIVKQSGGYIWVYSEPGHGTTFKLYFPATKSLVEPSLLRTEPSVSISGQVLLVVEDDAAIRAHVRECLQQLGYRVLDAEDATAALQICEEFQGQIDLVLTDLVMAGKSGHDLANDLAERYPKIRVLFMSGYTEDSATRRDILLRGSPFLQKPFSVAELAKAVRESLVLTPALAQSVSSQ